MHIVMAGLGHITGSLFLRWHFFSTSHSGFKRSRGTLQDILLASLFF